MTGVMQSFVGASFGSPYFFGRYGTTGQNQYNYVRGVAADSLGSLFFAGNQTLYNSGGSLILAPIGTLVKITSAKTAPFNKSYSQTSNEINLERVSLDSSGNIYLLGNRTASGSYRILLVKLDSNGVLQWSRILGTNAGLIFQTGDFGTDSSGNIYVGGYSKPDSSSGFYNFFLAKYDSSGNLQWQRELGQGTGNNVGQGFYADSSGNSYITGYSTQSGTTYGIVAKYDSSGNVQWQRSFISSSMAFSSGSAITADSSGNVYVAGLASGSIIIKYNSSGTIQWQRTVTNLQANMIAVDSSGNVYTGGEGTTYQGLILKYNSSGTLQWQRRINATLSGQNQKYWHNITVDPLGDLGVVGNTGQGAGGNNNNLGMIAKFPNSGAFTGTFTVGGTAYTISVSTETDSAGSVTGATSSLSSSASSYTSGSTTLSEQSNGGTLSLVNV